uniref:Uncharacterized protein n=1 Tax=Palpitomonas bilix TaxID=652834 RepID=A0A7S3FYL6_9EUKA|mmetsp:Transcript_10501/g.27498  ORF Transcript_10501/g.27498 Transcript_10501/m.27498 type:complete len:500 (+) Transcript_10501:101-1600(+)
MDAALLTRSVVHFFAAASPTSSPADTPDQLLQSGVLHSVVLKLEGKDEQSEENGEKTASSVLKKTLALLEGSEELSGRLAPLRAICANDSSPSPLLASAYIIVACIFVGGDKGFVDVIETLSEDVQQGLQDLVEKVEQGQAILAPSLSVAGVGSSTSLLAATPSRQKAMSSLDQAELKRLWDENRDLKEELEAMRLDNESLKSSKERLEETVAEMKQKIAEMQQDTSADKLKEKVAQLEKEKEELGRSAKNAKAEYESSVAIAEQKKKELEMQVNTLLPFKAKADQVLALQGKVRSLEEALRRQGSAAEPQHDVSAAQKAREDTLALRLAEKEEENARLLRQNENLTSSLQAATASMKTAEESYDDAMDTPAAEGDSRRVAELEQERDSLIRAFNEYKTKAQEVERENDRLKAKMYGINESQQSTNEQKRKLQLAERNEAKLKSTLNNVIAENDRLVLLLYSFGLERMSEQKMSERAKEGNKYFENVARQRTPTKAAGH